ncbi:MAG TPA: hypothetical protein VMA32_05765 [Streptosporangiaceae bacterium]|nr:hypothetical protein [Streptosporangiaceae bacterium]
MNISIQTLYDVLCAFAVVVGVACAYTLAIIAAGAWFKRTSTPGIAPRATTTPAPYSTQTEDARELVRQ